MRSRSLFSRFLALFPILLVVFVVLAVGAEATTGGATSYTPSTPVLDGVENGPWNTSQGDGTDSAFPPANLFPTYTPTSTSTSPNLALYPGSSGTPYPSGVAGTPGPLAGYCTPGFPSNGSSSLQSEPANLDLPMSPYYFPDVVRNPDGSLTGYFDYRPKDADEATVVAKSTDNGQTWDAEGEALGQNGSYCPTADANDDGEGHPFVTSVDGQSLLYTLQRPAGDNLGIGLLVHSVDPTAANPLNGLPASEPVGVDPNTFATAAVTVPLSGGVSIPVSTLGTAGSPEDIVAGTYEDINASSPSASIITCTGVSSGQLTGCTVAGASSLSVAATDDLVQVIASPTKTFVIPQGPPTVTDGSGGLATMNIQNANTVVSPLTTYILNVNAPNRIYIDGATVYCTQSNANPTNKLENCTTTESGGLTVNAGDAITADPIIPPTATMTSGLIAPDGIVGTVPSYPGAPSGSTVVLYTEKILSYFIEGTTNAKITLPTSTIAFTPSVTQSQEPLPSGSFSVYVGTAVGQPIQQVTCTGYSAGPGGTENLTGCSGGTGAVASGNWIGAPNAAIVPYSTLSQTGEGTNGASKGPEKLFGNNEDLTVLRAAYTTDGINFTDLGPISGSTSALGSTNGSYDDVSNPYQTVSPSNSNPTNLAPASQDTVELRWVGSRGTIITNPDGSYGMFLSGAWATDGDSDAFNQIFYTSSTDGKHWTTPVVVLSTDYTFSASVAQQGTTNPLGISAYYSGRAYGPAVVQNADGSLTMVFSGYRLSKPIGTVGNVLGTSGQYTIGPNDPALYRNILTMTLKSATSPAIPTSTAISSSASPSVYGTVLTYRATVSVTPPGTGTPTGTIAFTDAGSPIAGCTAVILSDTTPDTATCTTTPDAGTHQVEATYSGDSNYGLSSGSATQIVNKAILTVTADSKSRLFDQPNPELTATITGFVNGDTASAVTGSPACATAAAQNSKAGAYPINCSIGTLAAANYGFSFVPGTLSVTYPSKITFSAPPRHPRFGGHTVVRAHGDGSTSRIVLTIDPTSSTVCALGGDGVTVSFTGTGTCTIDATQAGDSKYAPASASTSFAVLPAGQRIHFTSSAPERRVGDSYLPSASGGASGNPVTFSIDAGLTSVCTLASDHVTVRFVGAGACLIDANQAGNSDYTDASQATQTVNVRPGTQAITFTSSPPSDAVVDGQSYLVSANGGPSGNPVSLTIAPEATDVCSIAADETVQFIGAGSCVIRANQAGNVDYDPAPQTSQSFKVAKGPQTIVFARLPAQGSVGYSSTIAATGGPSGKPVTFKVDASSAGSCKLNGSAVTLVKQGTCTIDANQEGSENYDPAPQAQATIVVK